MALYSTPIPKPGRAIQGLALCAGIGGLELGLTIAEPGHTTVCFVERETYPAATLVARMEDQALDHAPIWSDLKTFDGRPWCGKVDIVTAGYPCQPFTFSGKRKGSADPRHLWPHVARVIRQAGPEWVFCENVEGHLTLGFAEVTAELQRMGFGVKAGLFSAYETGASHARRRLFMLAHANRPDEWKSGRTGNQQQRPISSGSTRSRGIANRLARGSAHLVSVLSGGKGIRDAGRRSADIPLFAPSPSEFATWDQVLARRTDLQPAFFGLDDGLANRMERMRAAGNGVVPLEAALAYSTLKAAFKAD